MILLIGGSTHTGKTLAAQRVLEKYSYPYLSIDHLKMGLIRSGICPFFPESPDEELTPFLWGIIKEIVKTAIENGQNLVVEGCYWFPPGDPACKDIPSLDIVAKAVSLIRERGGRIMNVDSSLIAEFRSYHMHDALEPGGDIEKADAVFGAVPAQFPDHGVSRSVRERFRLVVRGNDVVHGGKGTFRVTHGQAQIPDHSESLRRGDFMQQVSSDEHLRSPIRQDADGMSVPDFLEKRFPHNWHKHPSVREPRQDARTYC